MANVPDLVVATYAQQPLWVLRYCPSNQDYWCDQGEWSPNVPAQWEVCRVLGWNAVGRPLGFIERTSPDHDDWLLGRLISIEYAGWYQLRTCTVPGMAPPYSDEIEWIEAAARRREKREAVVVQPQTQDADGAW